ncbi:MAG: sigma-70 family RNA polymerase sigma factor [Alphaproteobacteria bacterium]|nr:sigma-70 family RNA polymerase sigma factor [Alphaproteobacteria bacterium]
MAAGTAAARVVLAPPDADPTAAGDDFLIAAAAGGDGAAWTVLVDRYLGQITGHAWYMLGDPREAEDVAQEAFLRLFAKAPAWEPGGAQLKTWLYRVVVNLCIDRKRKVLPIPMAELPERPDGGAEARDRGIDIKRSVRAALDALPARQRSALVLTYYEGFTNREAGRLLGISAEAVESLLARGRRALKDALQSVHREMMGERK